MPSEAATSYFHPDSSIRYPTHVNIDLIIHYIVDCRGNIEGANTYISDSRAQSWQQICLLRKLWPQNNNDTKLQYIKKATKQFAYDEATKARKNILDKLALSTTSI
jgi:hypothetical protein